MPAEKKIKYSVIVSAFAAWLADQRRSGAWLVCRWLGVQRKAPLAKAGLSQSEGIPLVPLRALLVPSGDANFRQSSVQGPAWSS